jgi:Tfp pilus assembly protein PilF
MRTGAKTRPMTKDNAAQRNAHLMLGMQHHRAGRLDAAADIYQRLHAADQHDTEVLYRMGVLCCDLGAFEAACRFLEQALALAPAFPTARTQLCFAFNGLAGAQLASGLLDDAESSLTRALALRSNDPQTLQGLGCLALSRGDPAAAETWLCASLAGRGADAETLNWLGLAQLQQKKFAAAETSLREALRLRLDLNQARNNLGLALLAQGQLGEAQTCFEGALARDASYTSARLNLADTLRIRAEPEAARRELETLLAAQPDSTDALNNLGAVLQDLGLAESALACLTRAAALSPLAPQIRWNLALTQLQLGDFKNGWHNFEMRWEGCGHLRGGYLSPPDRAWRGESLRGKRLLLWAEQGFGDTLQFIRFAQDLARLGAEVTAVAQVELAELVRRVPGIHDVIVPGAPLPAYDFHSPLMSLPYRLGLSLDAAELQAGAPYLSAASDRIEYWRQRLAGYSGMKVGLAWAGSSRLQRADLAAIDARRSIRLSTMAGLLAVSGCSFFSLQKGVASAEIGAGLALHDFSDEWADFSETAAFIANLDLVISVDTAVVHLAGALGKPVWLLNRFDTCWRWLRDRADSPWYPTLRQFRQPRYGEWGPVIATAAAALAERVARCDAQHAETVVMDR